MRRVLAWPFESVHVLSAAVFFTVALLLTLLTAPGWRGGIDRMSDADAARHFHELASLVGRNGLWLAGAGLLGALVAPFARGDGKKKVAWTRIVCAATVLVLVVLIWGRIEGGPKWLEGDVAAHRSDKAVTPWNVLLAFAGLDLLLGAFSVAAGAKAAKKDSGDKKK